MSHQNDVSLLALAKRGNSIKLGCVVGIPLFLLVMLLIPKQLTVIVELETTPFNGITILQRLSTELKQHPLARRVIVRYYSALYPNQLEQVEYNRYTRTLKMASGGGCGGVAEEKLHESIREVAKKGSQLPFADVLEPFGCNIGHH